MNPLSDYIKEKLHVLDELHIKLTDEQKDFMKGLKSETAIDNYVRPFIINGYEKYGY